MTDQSVNFRNQAAVSSAAAGLAADRFGRVLVLGGGYTGHRFATALARLGIATTVSHRQAREPAQPATALDLSDPWS